MRYPVTATGSRADFERDWKIDQIFGAKTSYGFHEGADINLKTGGETDFNQELKAIANGRIVYYHEGHPTKNFGRHLVYRIDGPWGTRWVHYAHCNDLDFHGSVQDVTEGQIIARLGKSGTTSSHLHWSIFTVDPISFGIDNIANDAEELMKFWEDPIAFVNKWIALTPVPAPVISDPQTKLDFKGLTTPIETYNVLELGTVASKLDAKDKDITALHGQVQSLQSKVDQVKAIVD